MHCDTHGDFTSKELIIGSRIYWTKCPECRNEEDRKQREKDMIESTAPTLPVYFKEHTEMYTKPYLLSNEHQTTVYNIIESYINLFDENKNTGKNILMRGNPGTGKTHLAKRIEHKLWQKGYFVGYIIFKDLMARIKETYRPASLRTESEIIRDLLERDLIIIDEFGREKLSDHDKGILNDIIHKRHLQAKPMILITNMTQRSFEKELDPFTMDRLRDNSSIFLNFDWKTNRG